MQGAGASGKEPMLHRLLEKIQALVAGGREYRDRLVVATQFVLEDPQRSDESQEEYGWRVHWAVLTTLGLPPLCVARRWLKKGHPNQVAFIPPAHMIEYYLVTRQGELLRDGKPDPLVTNGQAEALLTISQRTGVNETLRPSRYCRGARDQVWWDGLPDQERRGPEQRLA